jgi:coenzyme Q-binding protein COQ10
MLVRILLNCALHEKPNLPKHSETRILPYTPEQLFDQVADVGRYGEFLPWVVAVRVRSNSDSEMIADLIVGFKALRESFTSRVRKTRPGEISVEYLEGPLKYLHNQWRFIARADGGTELGFMVDFAFRSTLFEAMAGQLFERAFTKMVAAFEARAHALYGNSNSSATNAA